MTKKKEDKFDYKVKLPRLAAYIDRIGATQYNFRSYGVVKFVNRYPKKIASIKFDPDGTIKVTGEQAGDFMPTKEEREAIGAEIKATELPRSVNFSEAKAGELRSKLKRKGQLFLCYTRSPKVKGDNVIMVEERVEKDDGTKDFYPWTFWSDGEWRCMEPNDTLPLWKPKVEDDYERGNKLIMIHEGPKVAKYLTELKNKPKALAAHPFAEEIARYEHWGMLGGAFRASDADWEELRAEKPAEAIYACDNDYPGKKALEAVSRGYRKSLLGLKVDDKWPAGWDMADAMPVELFSETTKRYIGPKFEELLEPATWATELVSSGKEGRPSPIITLDFAQEWSHSVEPEVYMHHRRPSKMWLPDQFNNLVRPFSHVDDTARLMKKDSVYKAAIIAYHPDKPSGKFVDNEGTFFNTFMPSLIKPLPGDVKPWEEFLTHLVPNEKERHELKRWCATLIARPGSRMLFGLLLISEAQGIGKGTLGERILAPILGEGNVSYPAENEVVDSNYNYWAAHKRLSVVHEIYAGHSSKAYNKLKSIITDKNIRVSKKYQAIYEIKNWIHVFACSNSLNALQLSDDDRRWFVPKLTDDKRDREYWEGLHRWLSEDGGLEKIVHWALDFVKIKGNVVLPGERPMITEAKTETVKAGYSKGMARLADQLEGLKEAANGKPLVTTDTSCVDFIRNAIYNGVENSRLEKLSTCRRVAASAGWYISKGRVKDGKFGKSYLISTDKGLVGEEGRLPNANELRERATKKKDITFLDDLIGAVL
jgi:hypothetical protein